MHIENNRKLAIELTVEYGQQNYEQKIRDFVDFGRIPFSLIGHHTAILREIQTAFVCGAYYPALAASCTLAERILNQLIYGLKDHYKNSASYDSINKKEWLQNWYIASQVLREWNVIDDAIRREFMELHALRSLGVHFRDYDDVLRRDKALEAIRKVINVTTTIFGIDGGRYWMLKGTRGGIFVAKDFENDPFVKEYVIPHAHLVGPFYSVEFEGRMALIIDQPEYPDMVVTDEQFASIYNDRKPEQLARRKVQGEDSKAS